MDWFLSWFWSSKYGSRVRERFNLIFLRLSVAEMAFVTASSWVVLALESCDFKSASSEFFWASRLASFVLFSASTAASLAFAREVRSAQAQHLFSDLSFVRAS